MATYPGMNLSGEIRESISLDEDDLSDVEDEVFIRDGKARFKYSEDIGLKRPLMAPRRKLSKPDFKSRLRNRPPCRPYCKPCCYMCGGLLVLMGLIVLVVIIVSMFPLPIDKMKNWIVTKSKESVTDFVLPCSELKVTNVWTVTLPKLTSDSSIRTVDIDQDGVEDIIFGFGTGDSSAIRDEIFCPIFVGVLGPCGGGVMALNGLNGKVIWRKHLPYVVYTVFCSADLNSDGINDCVVTGKKGMLLTVNSKDGGTIWEFNDLDADKGNQLEMDIYTGNFIPDQDNDTVSDLLVSHTYQKGNDRSGHLMLISGQTGKEIKRVTTPNNVETYYIPQLLPQRDGQYLILLGTGNPNSNGNLTTISLANFLIANASFNTIYEHKSSGVISPSILVDITGDGQLDIVSAMFNSTIVAIDGATFTQVWNISVNNSETLSIPTPGFFNDDNVTDFLVKYQTGPGFPIYYYSQTFVINGKTGEVINASRFDDSVGSQMAGLTLGSEKKGYDFFLYWTADCKGFEGRKDKFSFLNNSTLNEANNVDFCRLRFNSTKVTKLYAMNQYDQPPGFELYSSDNMIDIEYNNTKTPLEEASEYLNKHPGFQVQKTEESDNQAFRPKPPTNIVNKFKNSAFRHKYDDQGLLKNYNKPPDRQKAQKYEDYEQNVESTQPKLNYPLGLRPPPEEDYNYPYEEDPAVIYNDNKNMFDLSNRDTRGDESGNGAGTNKKDLNKNGIYEYQNIKQSRHRLLHDLNSSPTEILKETYYKNLERQLRKSRFEQRDLKSHNDKMKENEEITKVIDAEKNKAVNVSVNLWDLETEKEMEDRKYGYSRGKRNNANVTQTGVPWISSIGTIVKTLDPTLNAVDLIFLTYWTPSKSGPIILNEKDLECIANKLKTALNSKGTEEMMNFEPDVLEDRFKTECLNERGAYEAASKEQEMERQQKEKLDFPYKNEISEISLGQLTVYRIRVECIRCDIKNKGERCAKFLNPTSTNVWSAYLNRIGNGIFNL